MSDFKKSIVGWRNDTGICSSTWNLSSNSNYKFRFWLGPPHCSAACPTCSLRRDSVTCVSEYFPMGLSNDRQAQAGLFLLFETTYLLTLLGNGFILLVVLDTGSHLHRYFFLYHIEVVAPCSGSYLLHLQQGSPDTGVLPAREEDHLLRPMCHAHFTYTRLSWWAPTQ